MSDYILKIGGSVLTDKNYEETLSERFEDILEDIRPGGILVHGAGSYGHPHADRHGLADGSRHGVLETHRAVKKLNRHVVDEIRKHDISAYPVHSSSMSCRDIDTRMDLDPAAMMVEEGFIPVLHGDGIVHSGKGFSVLSGDEIATRAQKELGYDKLGFCTSVPGVLDDAGNVIDRIDSFEQFDERGVEGVDVTGGMKNKLEKIFEKEVDARVFGVDEIEEFMDGEAVGTLIKGSAP